MLKDLSTRAARALLFTAVVLPVVACVDARKRTDAPTVDQLPNIDGEWLLAVEVQISPGQFVQMRVTWDLTANGATGTLDGTYRALKTQGISPDSPDRVVVGDPFVADDVAVDNTASFSAHLGGTPGNCDATQGALLHCLNGMANPVTGSAYPVDIMVRGTLKSADLVCGTLSGTVGPLDVNGWTFGAVRINGATLPAPVGACPATAIDAGVDAPIDAAVDASPDA